MPAGHDISSSGDETILRSLNADITRSSTTPAIVSPLSIPLGLGSYVFQVYAIVQSAATTTGYISSMNFTGTKGIFAYNIRWLTNVSASSDDVATSAYTTAAAGVISGYAARTPTTAGTGTITDVDATNSDVLIITEGIISVSAAGSLDYYWAPEAAANSTLKAGSSVICWKTG